MSEPTNYPCMRCGDAFPLDVTDAYTPCVCDSCSDKALDVLGEGDADALARWRERYMKGRERHPTWLALVASLNDADSPF